MNGGKIIKHPDFDDKSPGLFEDSCHLSFIGKDLFLNTFQVALDTLLIAQMLKFTHHLAKFLLIKVMAVWFQLSGGDRLAALAVHPLTHWRKLKTTLLRIGILY